MLKIYPALRRYMIVYDTMDDKTYGFSAQNFKQARDQMSFADYINIVDEEDPDMLKIQPDNIIALLVQAVKDLGEKNRKIEEYLFTTYNITVEYE